METLNSKILVEVKDLKKYFPVDSKSLFRKNVLSIKAVDGVSFTINKGETLGLVGESGCGKTTVGRCVLRLLEASAGKVYFKGEDVFNLHQEQLRNIRKKMQIIFQDPYSSLDPRTNIGQIVAEPLRIHHIVTSKDRKLCIQELLETAGLSSKYLTRYPHELSGGERQRVGIARALAVKPELIICDEPVSALDVSIQAQIINLLQDLQRDFNLSYLFISHNLSVVKHISNRVAVMYLGKIVELTAKEEIFRNPLHPYTQALLGAIPIPDPQIKRKNITLTGDVPSPINLPSGCRFRTRCPRSSKICSEQEPEFKMRSDQHFVACHLA